MLTNQTIVIDPGHGGTQAAGKSSAYGARGPSGTLEKDVTLALASEVARELGPSAMLTRRDDRNLPLAERCELARRMGASVFVSLHADAGAPGERGARTFAHPRASSASRLLARGIAGALGARSLSGDGIELGELAVLTPERHAPHTAMCLVEIDNLLDAGGEARLRDPAEVARLGRAIATGIRRYVGAEAPYGRGALLASTNDPPRQGRREDRKSSFTDTGVIYPEYPVPNNEITLQFSGLAGYPDPIDCVVTATLHEAIDRQTAGARLGQHSVAIVGEQQPGYITFSGQPGEPIGPWCRIEVTVYNRITPGGRVGLDMSIWT